MTVYVIMSNDYPDSVFGNRAEADAYCILKTSANINAMIKREERKVYWRVYPFEVQGAAPSAASPTAEAFNAMADVFTAKAVYCDQVVARRESGLSDEAWHSVSRQWAREGVVWREAARDLRKVAGGEPPVINRAGVTVVPVARLPVITKT